MVITSEQAYRPVLWKQPSEMDDKWLRMTEWQLRTRNPDSNPSKKDEILSALSEVREEMWKRNLDPI